VPLPSLRLVAVFLFFLAVPLRADALHADLSGYKTASGLAASTASEALIVTWEGDGLDGRLTFEIREGAPVIRELAARRKGGPWIVLATNATAEFRVVLGLRRIVSATDLPRFGKHRFEIPFDARRKKWVRFAVWDSAGNGPWLNR
jgi:hypothetical protein